MAQPEEFVNWVTNQPTALVNAVNSTFGPAGANHTVGLVPDPGSSSHSPAWLLGDDGAFHAITTFTTVTNTSLSFLIDGGGGAPTTGIKGYILIPFGCTINSNTLLADQSGSIVVDIFKCTFTQFDAGATHPVSGDKITSSTPPTITASTKSQDSTLSGWTTTINANDVLAFNVNSATTITRVTLTLFLTKS